MGNTIHFPEKHRQKLMDGFRQKSETESLFSHDLDMEFSGVRTVHVTSIKTYDMQDYDRSKAVGSGSRYGDTVEVGDEVQTFEMTKDRSLSLSVDKGNNAEQFNMKKAGAIMRAQRDEKIVPEIDTYRLQKWSENGGIHKELDAEPTKKTIASQIISLHNDMLDAGVPDSGVTLLIRRKYLPDLKLAEEWVGLDSLGGKTLPKGCMGEFDGMAVKPITNKRFPNNAAFMLLYKGSVISPMKINDFKGHVDPPGLSGDLLEFRMIYDAFVLGKKAAGVAVGCLPGTVAAAPTIAVDGGKATITAAGSKTIRYTTDGSDPRYSKDAKVYTAPVAVTAGDIVVAYAEADGKWNSATAEASVSA
jgi:hypothetical protein